MGLYEIAQSILANPILVVINGALIVLIGIMFIWCWRESGW
jgi:hypothetical protein